MARNDKEAEHLKMQLRDLLNTYGSAFDNCANIDSIIRHCTIMMINNRPKNGILWEQNCAKSVMINLKAFIEAGVEVLLILSRVHSDIVDSFGVVSRPNKKDKEAYKEYNEYKNRVDKCSFHHTPAWQSFVTYLKKMQSKEHPFETLSVKTTQPPYYIDALEAKTKVNSKEAVRIDKKNEIQVRNINEIKDLFAKLYESVGFDPAKDISKTTTTTTKASTTKTRIKIIPNDRCGYNPVAAKICGYSKSIYKDNGVRIQFNLSSMLSDDVNLRLIEDIGQLCELASCETQESLTSKLFEVGRFGIYICVDKKKDTDNPYKIVKGDGFCAYRSATVLRSFYLDKIKPGDEMREDIDLDKPSQRKMFQDCIHDIYKEADATRNKAIETISNTVLPDESSDSCKATRAALVEAEDVVNRGENHLKLISRAMTPVDAYVQACEEGKKAKLTNLHPNFYPESEVFMYCRFPDPIIIYEQDNAMNKEMATRRYYESIAKPKSPMWIRPLIEIGGASSSPTSNTPAEQFGYNLSLEEIFDIITVPNNVVHVGENHYDLYYRSDSQMKEEAELILQSLEDFGTTLYNNRETILTSLKEVIARLRSDYYMKLPDNQREGRVDFAMLQSLSGVYLQEGGPKEAPSIENLSFTDAQKAFNNNIDDRLLFKFPPDNLVSTFHCIGGSTVS